MLESGYKFGEVADLASQVEFGNDKVQFHKIFDNNNGCVSVLAFRAGQKLDTHQAPAVVMVCALEGTVEFTMLDVPHTLQAGQFLLMGADVPHSVCAKTDAKIALIKVKP